MSEAGGAIIKRGFYWGMNPNPTATDNFSENENGLGVYSENVNLNYGHQYFFRSYALNSKGTHLGEVLLVKVEIKPQLGSMIDSRDGRAYPTVKIHNQTWMAKNLGYIPSISQPWRGSETLPFYYVYDFDDYNRFDAIASANYITFGVLYNWVSASTACPPGWHLPSDVEWTILTDYLGILAGGFMKEAGTKKWQSPNAEANNFSGFTGLPGGYLREDPLSGGYFLALGFDAYFWSASENDLSDSWGTFIPPAVARSGSTPKRVTDFRSGACKTRRGAGFNRVNHSKHCKNRQKFQSPLTGKSIGHFLYSNLKFAHRNPVVVINDFWYL
ncbi:MAG: fibrobacter succinogenes major paralogous domain-containing protein [Bacteroidia bacterium]|nr:fibrobacter succinogenes major paralogous domain-containing protein [Bacteroidia bacterium]